MSENKIFKFIIKILLTIIALILILAGILLSACGGFITIINIIDYRDYSNILFGIGYLILGLFIIYLSDIIHKKFINNNHNPK